MAELRLRSLGLLRNNTRITTVTTPSVVTVVTVSVTVSVTIVTHGTDGMIGD